MCFDIKITIELNPRNPVVNRLMSFSICNLSFINILIAGERPRASNLFRRKKRDSKFEDNRNRFRDAYDTKLNG